MIAALVYSLIVLVVLAVVAAAVRWVPLNHVPMDEGVRHVVRVALGAVLLIVLLLAALRLFGGLI